MPRDTDALTEDERADASVDEGDAVGVDGGDDRIDADGSAVSVDSVADTAVHTVIVGDEVDDRDEVHLDHPELDDDERDPAGSAGSSVYGDDEYAYDDEYDDDEADVPIAASVYPDRGHDAELFDGDPDEFELEIGGMAVPAEPAAGDVLVFDDPVEAPRPAPKRMSRVEHRRRVKLQARRVRRIVRHVEPWSVLKISLMFYACLWVIFLIAGFMIWGVAESSGTIGKLEDLMQELFALDEFTFEAGQIFRGYALGGLALSIAGATFNVLMCLLFNLISDLTGGLRITMIEEETARPEPPRRRRRRAPARR